MAASAPSDQDALTPATAPTTGGGLKAHFDPGGPPPSARTTEDALEIVAEVERTALGVFGRHGLPQQNGLYGKKLPDGVWTLMSGVDAASRWSQILDNPPERGVRYGKLTDVARNLRPEVAQVHAAAAIIDRVADLRALLDQSSGEDNSRTLLMFWSTIELMIVLMAGRGRRSEAHAGVRRSLEWDVWRTEARRIWQGEPHLSMRQIAKRVVDALDLAESPHTVRRRLSGQKPT